MIIFYDLHYAEQSQIRFSDAQFWRSLARLSRQLAVSGSISAKATRLMLPLEGILRALSVSEGRENLYSVMGFEAVAMIAPLK